MRKYTIRAGASFVTTDKHGKPVTLTGGKEIELEDDVAAAHAQLLEPVVQAPGQPEGQADAPAGEPAAPQPQDGTAAAA